MLRLAKWLVVPVVLGLLLGIAAPALALVPISGGPPYIFSSVAATSCEPYGTIRVKGALRATSGTFTERWSITNLRTGASLFVEYSGVGSVPDIDPYYFEFDELVPVGTQPGDMLLVEASGTYNGKPFSTSIAFDCSTGLTWTPRVAPVSGEEAAPFLAVTAPNGQQACGVFNVLGHGPKVIQMAQFPDCTGPASDYTVYCFTSNGTWTDQYVTDVAVDNDDNLTFTSGQHGHCGLFPAP